MYVSHIHPAAPQAFAQDKFGPLKNCPSGGDWEAILVEAGRNLAHFFLYKTSGFTRFMHEKWGVEPGFSPGG